MAKKPETLFKERLFRKLREVPGLYIRKIQAGSVGGMPDILIIVNGWAVMPELKMPGNNPTPLQWINIERINAAGGAAFPLYPNEEREFIEWIKELRLEI
jgi:hypothetical protein